MQGIARTSLEIKTLRSLHGRSRLHCQHIRIEFVGTHIWLLEHRVVEVKVKSGDSVRNSHVYRRLVNLHQLSLISPVHDYSRIKILSFSHIRHYA